MKSEKSGRKDEIGKRYRNDEEEEEDIGEKDEANESINRKMTEIIANEENNRMKKMKMKQSMKKYRKKINENERNEKYKKMKSKE